MKLSRSSFFWASKRKGKSVRGNVTVFVYFLSFLSEFPWAQYATLEQE